MEYYYYHYYLVVVVVVVFDDDTYYWVYLSSDHPFQVYYKVRQVLLQSAMVCYCQVRQCYYKVRQNTNPPPPGVKIPWDTTGVKRLFIIFVIYCWDFIYQLEKNGQRCINQLLNIFLKILSFFR